MACLLLHVPVKPATIVEMQLVSRLMLGSIGPGHVLTHNLTIMGHLAACSQSMTPAATDVHHTLLGRCLHVCAAQNTLGQYDWFQLERVVGDGLAGVPYSSSFWISVLATFEQVHTLQLDPQAVGPWPADARACVY